MNKLLSETLGMCDVLLCTATDTSRFVSMRNARKVAFVASIGAMTAGSTVVLTGRESDDDGATNQAISKVVDGATATLTATVAANTNVSEATIAPAIATTAGSTLTVNGVVYTAVTAGMTAVATNEFSTATAIGTLASNIAAVINGVNTAGASFPAAAVAGVTATASSANVTLNVDDPLETTITLATNNAADLVLATVRACAYLEVDATMLSDGYDHAGVLATITGGGPTRIIAVPGSARYNPPQQAVAAGANQLA